MRQQKTVPDKTVSTFAHRQKRFGKSVHFKERSKNHATYTNSKMHDLTTARMRRFLAPKFARNCTHYSVEEMHTPSHTALWH